MPEVKLYSGSGEDKIGPGHYDINNFDISAKTQLKKEGTFALSKTT